MQRHSEADESYYITADRVLNLAKRAYEIFESSEVPEKTQLLNFLLQNLKLQGKKLSFELKTPFDTMLQVHNCSIMGGLRDAFRTIDWRKIEEEIKSFKIISQNKCQNYN